MSITTHPGLNIALLTILKGKLVSPSSRTSWDGVMLQNNLKIKERLLELTRTSKVEVKLQKVA